MSASSFAHTLTQSGCVSQLLHGPFETNYTIQLGVCIALWSRAGAGEGRPLCLRIVLAHAQLLKLAVKNTNSTAWTLSTSRASPPGICRFRCAFCWRTC